MTEPPPAREVGRFDWEQAFRATPKGDPLTVAVVAVGLVVATWSTTTTGGDVRPAQDTVALVLGVHRATVARALGTLVRLGWLASVARPTGRPAIYRLTIPEVSQQCEPSQQREGGVAPLRGGCRTSATGPAHGSAPGPSHSTLETREAASDDVWTLAERSLAAAADWSPEASGPVGPITRGPAS
jgi:DNA-binding transcriptional MocR family regulator